MQTTLRTGKPHERTGGEMGKATVEQEPGEVKRFAWKVWQIAGAI
jgi:hypothetical protein